jgi:hypothetical protein
MVQRAAGSACANYIVIDSRGSGERGGLSAPGAVFYPTFRAAVLKRDRSAKVSVIPNGYPAWGSIPTLISALAKLPQQYNKSVVAGTQWLSDELSTLRENCPTSKFVLTGYSQGAHLTGDAYQKTSPTNILGVVLFGDPKFNSNDPAARGGKSGLDGALGTRPLYTAAPGKQSTGHVLSYCHDGDPVCQGVSRLRFGSAPHRYDGTNEPQEAANYLARFISSAPSTAPSAPTAKLRVGGLQIDAVGYPVCEIRQSRRVECWGPDLTTSSIYFEVRWTPQTVVGLSGTLAGISVSSNEACVLDTKGTVKCWGARSPLVDKSPIPIEIPFPEPVVRVAVGGGEICALSESGTVWCKGNQRSPRRVLDDAIMFDAGSFHLCAVKRDGAVYCWGLNNYDQVGGQPPSPNGDAVAVRGLPGPAVSVAGGYDNSCAVVSDGSVYCWGYQKGATRDPSGADLHSIEARKIDGISEVVQVAGGMWSTCVLTARGAIWCWGNNGYGQLGIGSKVNSTRPVAPVGLERGIIEIGGGGGFFCAIRVDRRTFCWGLHTYGSVGISSGQAAPLVPREVKR